MVHRWRKKGWAGLQIPPRIHQAPPAWAQKRLRHLFFYSLLVTHFVQTRISGGRALHIRTSLLHVILQLIKLEVSRIKWALFNSMG